MFLRSIRSRSFAALILTGIPALAVVVATPATAQQPAAPPQRPASHTVKRGDTLWDLAKLYLGDPFLWPEIYRINTDLIEDPHWIYPGEVLKLPQDATKIVAVTPVERQPTAAPTPTPTPTAPVTPALRSAPTSTPTAAPVDTPTMSFESPPPPVPTVRMGEYLAAPWVDQRGGPRGSGAVLGVRDAPGIETQDRSRMNLEDEVLVAPPVGSVAPEHELYLAYRFGPLIENFGQIVVPTGVIEITRSARNGEAAVGRVVKLFDEMLQGQRLIPLDSAAAIGFDHPRRVANGTTGRVRWVNESPVLPNVQDFLVIDIPRPGVRTGDEVDLFIPRRRPEDGGTLATPELLVGTAQILRVTPYGASAVLVHTDQPRINAGLDVRVAAKMP